MRDLSSPLLPRQVVSGLVGISSGTLRRWENHGLFPSTGRRRAPHLYSWRDVERLQRAVYLAGAGRIPLAQVTRLLEQGPPAGLVPASATAPARPASRLRHPRRGDVVAVAPARSARRRERGLRSRRRRLGDRRTAGRRRMDGSSS